MAVYTWAPSALEVAAGRPQARSKPRLYGETWSEEQSDFAVWVSGYALCGGVNSETGLSVCITSGVEVSAPLYTSAPALCPLSMLPSSIF